MDIFGSKDYRFIISASLEEKKSLNRKYTFQSMAAHMRIQKPYLSKVMNNRADFNTDQLYLACDYLGFDENEKDYLLLLLELERSSVEERRNELLDKVELIQESKRNTKEVLGREIREMTPFEFDNSTYVDYYLNPLVMIVHICLTIPRFRNDLTLLSKELRIDYDQLEEIINKLSSMKLIEFSNKAIRVLLSTMHLPRESSIVLPHQQLLSQLSSQRKNGLSIGKKKSFSVTFSSNEDNRKDMEWEFNKFTKKIRELSQRGDKKHCYQINFDLFPWTSV